jgi:hypothetical protein
MIWARCEKTGKVRFSDIWRAEKALAMFKEKNRGRKFNSPERYYLCEHCDMYHLTHYKTAPSWIRQSPEVALDPIDIEDVTSRLNFLLNNRK